MLLFEPRVSDFFVRVIGHTLTQVPWTQRTIRGKPKPNAPKKHNYPKDAASLVTRGGPHDTSHVVDGFSGTRHNPHFFLFCQVGSLPYILLENYAFYIYVQSASHCEQALRYSSEKMATRRIARNHKEMLEMTVKGTTNNGRNTKVRTTPSLS